MSWTTPARPALTADLAAEEFQRWYWLKDELAAFARVLGIRATGGKELLAARIVAKLSHQEFLEPDAPQRGGAAQLSSRLSPETVIPAGQRCSQVVRAWMTEQVGEGFRFDAAMRKFFAESDGTRTMKDALDHWHATRGREANEIGAQFEYNRFTRAWCGEHPDGGRDELLAAWQEYRGRPVEERGRA